MKKISYEKLDGKTKNLLDQARKLADKSNQGASSSRHRYMYGQERFCKWLAENTNVKKLVNIKVRHFKRYVDALKANGLSRKMINAELSSIRHFHALTGSKERLPKNERLGLEKANSKGGVNRSWTSKELEKAINLAEKTDRTDVSAALKISYAFGCRIEEAMTLTNKQLKDAMQNNILDLKNTKGGRPRGVYIGTDSKYAPMQKRALEYALQHSKSRDKAFIKVGQQTHKAIKSVQNWIYYNRDNFQNEDRIHRDAAREIADTARNNKEQIERPKAQLTMHGLRHSFANNMYKEILQEKIQEHKEHSRGNNKGIDKEKLQELERAARGEVSQLLGHNRINVTWVYVDGQWVAEIEIIEE